MHRLILGAALLMAAPASANIFDVFGAGARSQAMAGAVGAITADYMAAFHNPAGLAQGPPSIGLGVTGTFDRSAILLTPRPAGYDPPVYGTRQRPRRDTENPAGTAGLVFGGSLRLFSEDLTLGATLFAPFEGFIAVDSRFADEREQFFSNRLEQTLIGDRLQTMVLAVALAYRLRPWLSMGIGMMLLPQAGATAPVYVANASDLSDVDINAEVSQGTRRALTAGVLIKPVDWLRLGVTFQDELWFGIDGGSAVQLRGEEEGGPIAQPIDLVTGYSPVRVSTSVALVADDVFTATLEGTWHAWSRYLDDHGVRAEFEDTFEGKLGVEWPVARDTFARAGVAYAPSPVPAQTGRTNFVDNDRIAFAFGAGSEFTLWDFDLTLDVAFVVHSLVTERVRKTRRAGGDYPDCAEAPRGLCDEVPDRAEDTPLLSAADTLGLQTGNPGFPGYTHGGYVVSAGVDLKWRF